ncbi:hypothetical protein [Nostoc sp. UHCC 0870]|nr:hypothetical protein [Nostoc sp. UHCC 0870]
MRYSRCQTDILVKPAPTLVINIPSPTPLHPYNPTPLHPYFPLFK